MPIGIALGIAGAGLVGDLISSSGQSQTNAANIGQTQQTQQWETQMSDTAMQRRVADLQASGLNPMLAVQQGGASTPGLSPIAMQNPASSFSGLGGQAASAAGVAQQQTALGYQKAQTDSQVGLNTANANKAAADANYSNVLAAKAAGVDTNTAQQSILESQSRMALQQAQAQQATSQAALSNQQIRVADATVQKIQVEMDNIRSATSLNQVEASLDRVRTLSGTLSNIQQQYITPYVVTSAANAAKLSGLQIPEGQSRADFWTTKFGQAMPYVEAMKPVIEAAVFAGTAGRVVSGARGVATAAGAAAPVLIPPARGTSTVAGMTVPLGP